MYGCESWTIKKAECWRIDAFELWCWRRLKSPLDFKEIQSVHPKGDQSWVFIGRTDVDAETPILWPPDVKSWLIWKDPDAGKDWGQEKGTTEDEMVGWLHWHNGHGFGCTLGVGDGQGGLACCSSWGCKGSDTTEHTTIIWIVQFCLFFSTFISHFGSVQSLSCVRLFATLWTTAHLASLSIINSHSPPKPMSIVLVGDGQGDLACCGS